MMGSSEAFRIDVVPSSCEVTVVVCGDIDLATANQVDEHLQAVERSRRDVAIDLLQVEFIDAAALRVLVASNDRLQATGRRLALRNVSGSPHRVLDLAGLVGTFDLVE